MKKRRMFDINLPDDPGEATPETFPAGKVEPRRGPMASAIAETVGTVRERADIEAKIRAENDALAHEHMRLRRLGLVVDLVPLDAVDQFKLVRDRKAVADIELRDLCASIRELGLSNPIRLEARDDGRFELVQGFRRLSAYRALLDETKDTEAWGRIPAVVMPAGDGLEQLYRRMVDENLVRKDISFAEMAQLALDYARDPQTEETDPEKAVAVLFKSAGYQKRSYIRGFIPVIERLGSCLRYAEEIPRALGLALAKRLDEDEGFVPMVRDAFRDWESRSVTDEVTTLRRLVGQGEDDTQVSAPAAPAAKSARPTKAKTSFQFDRSEGRGKCVAASGKVEIVLDRDFTTVDRRKLEQAVRAFLDQLDR